jgi:predicted Ser/Thr protein kinase
MSFIEFKPKRSWVRQEDPEGVIELTDILDEGASGAVFQGVFNGEKVAVKIRFKVANATR